MSTKLTTVSVADVVSIDEFNISRSGPLYSDDADRNRMASLLATGWNPALSVVEVTPLTDEQADIAMAAREAQWAALEAATEDQKISLSGSESCRISAGDVREAFRSAFFTSAGKLRKPKYMTVGGNRRTMSIPYALAIASKQDGYDVQRVLDMPVAVATFQNEADRSLACLIENTNKNAGTRSLTVADHVNAARHLYRLGSNENTLRKAFKAGTAQKLFAMCRLDALLPDINFIDSALARDDSREYIASLDKEDLRKAVKSLTDAGITDEGEIDVVALDSAVASVTGYLTDPKAVPPKPKTMNRKNIQSLHDQNPIKLVQLTCKAILADDAGKLGHIVGRTNELNAAFTAILNGERLYTQADVDVYQVQEQRLNNLLADDAEAGAAAG